MRVLGIDFGTVNIGLAISDSDRKVASALSTITYSKNNYLYAVQQIQKVLHQYQDVELIILGYPTLISGKATSTTKKVDEFYQVLQSNIDLKIILFDENYSTQKTTEHLKNIELKSSQIKKIKDKLAAQYILQSYLDYGMTKPVSLETVKQECINNRIALVRELTLKALNKLIQVNNVTSILEIGTAYGYSALAMSQNPSVKKIVTLEKRLDDFVIANQNLARQMNVQTFNISAFDYQTKQKFDLIFLDGPKSHQDVLFEKFSQNLNPNGIIFIDNIFLRKFANRTELTKNQQKLVNNVKAFREWLLQLKDWDVQIFDVEDGYAICKRK